MFCSRALEVFRFFLDWPNDVSAHFAMETKKFKVNKFGTR